MESVDVRAVKDQATTEIEKKDKKLPRVAIALLTYNHEKYIERSIKSALEQDYKNLLIYISDDCSTDRTASVIEKTLRENKSAHDVIFIKREKNLGFVDHLNTVVAELENKADLIVYQCGDDTSLSERVKKIVKSWENAGYPKYFYLHTPVNKVDDNDRALGLWIPPLIAKVNEKIIATTPTSHGLVIGASVAFTPNIIGEMPFTKNKIYEDQVMTFRAYLWQCIHYLPEPLVNYRFGVGITHETNKTKNNARVIETTIDTLEQRLIDAKYFKRHDLELLIYNELQEWNRLGSVRRVTNRVANLHSLHGNNYTMSEPLITVVILSYNNAKYIGRCIESVLSQDVEGLELIVLDDASTDGSEAVISRFLGDPRISYVRNEKNMGLNANWNKACKSGSGKYIAILGSDDFFYPGHLKDLVDTLEANPNCILAYCPCVWVDEDDRVIRVATHPGHPAQSYIGGRNELADLLIYDNYITPSAVVIRRKELVADGPFDPEVKLAGDWDLWCRLAIRNPNFAFVNRPSVAYRIHPGQVSHQFYSSGDPLYDHLVIVEKILKSEAAPRLKGSEDRIWALIEARVKAYSQYLDQETLKRVESIKCALERLKTAESRSVAVEGPLVSVIVPTYNRPDLLMRALGSIREQTYPNIEIVVINDFGVDVADLTTWLSQEVNLVYVRHGKNRGLAAARNTGLRIARGEIITYLDDDDVFLPNHVATVVEHLKKGDTPFVYTEAEYVLESTEHGQMKVVSRGQPDSGFHYSKERLHVCNFIPVNTWGHWKSIIDKIGYFDESFDNHEDWEFLLRCSREFDLRHIPKITVQVHQRVRADNMLHRERHKFYDTFQRIYAKYDDLGDPKIAEGRRQMLQQLLATRS